MQGIKIRGILEVAFLISSTFINKAHKKWTASFLPDLCPIALHPHASHIYASTLAVCPLRLHTRLRTDFPPAQ